MRQKGFAPILLLIVVMVVVIGGYYVFRKIPAGQNPISRGMLLTEYPSLPSSPLLDAKPGKILISKPKYSDISQDGDNGYVYSLLSSQNGETSFYISRSSKDGTFATINGKDQEHFNDKDPLIENAQINDEGSIVVYTVNYRQGGFAHFVNGKKVEDGFYTVLAKGGKSVATIHQNDKNENWVAVNGIPEKKYDYISEFYFSKDGKHYVYIAKTNPPEAGVVKFNDLKETLVRDGKEIITLPRILNLAISEDGKQVYYSSETIDGGESRPYSVLNEKKMDQYVFKPVLGRENNLAYVANKDGKEWVVLNDEKMAEFDLNKYEIREGSLNGYIDPSDIYKRNGDNTLMVSKDWKKVAYVMRDKTLNKYALYVNNENVSGWKSQIGYTNFSDNGAIGYYAQDSNEDWALYVDKEMKEKFDHRIGGGLWEPNANASDPWLTFTVDGKKLFFSKPPQGNESLDLESGEKENLPVYYYDVAFSPNGKNYAYIGNIEDINNSAVFINNKKVGDEYKRITSPVFLNDELVRYFGFDGTGVYQVTEKVQ